MDPRGLVTVSGGFASGSIYEEPDSLRRRDESLTL